MEQVTTDMIKQAANRLMGVIHHTPLTPSATFSHMAGADVYLKPENLQRTGSFKIRGAYNKIATLDSNVRGVIAASAGNHAQGVALAARENGIRATIVMPTGAPLAKVSATQGYGAEAILYGATYDDAYLYARELAKERGYTYIHAFNDPYIIAGQGTVGREILEELPDVQTVVVPVGGGGLISGIAIALKEHNPKIRVIGVQSELVPAAYERFKGKEPEERPPRNTIADGIAIKQPGEITLPLIRKYVDDLVLVSEEELSRAILLYMERAKLIVEGAGATSLAALLYQDIKPRGKTVLVISGGNIDVNMVSRIIERGLVKAGRYGKLSTVLSDIPGELDRLLRVLSGTAANIISVRHDRLRGELPLGTARVELTLETRDKDHLAEVVESLLGAGYKVNPD